MKTEMGSKAGAKPGAALMGLSLKRAGSNMIEATGKPGMSAKSAGFDSAGTKRNGSTRYSCYPDASESNAAYRGGVGTGEGSGSQG